ncbi:hypothetical protein AB5J72_02775 [Streptomyces sp. CG1]
MDRTPAGEPLLAHRKQPDPVNWHWIDSSARVHHLAVRSLTG